MKKLSVFVLVLVLGILCYAAPAYVFKRFDPQTTTGQTAAFQFATGQSASSNQYAVNDGFVPKEYTITITPTGSPATCTYQVLGSVKLANENPVFADFSGGNLTSDITCTSKVSVHVSGKSWITIMGNLTALSGGSSPTVQLEVLATR
jgi:hypothetical protein